MCTVFLFWESQCGGELGQLIKIYAFYRAMTFERPTINGIIFL